MAFKKLFQVLKNFLFLLLLVAGSVMCIADEESLVTTIAPVELTKDSLDGVAKKNKTGLSAFIDRVLSYTNATFDSFDFCEKRISRLINRSSNNAGKPLDVHKPKFWLTIIGLMKCVIITDVAMFPWNVVKQTAQ